MTIHRKRPLDEIRAVSIETNYLTHPEGSVLISTGDTKVICTASIDNKVKDWLKGKGKGWVTAEYAMLPRANSNRKMREGQFGRWPASRSQEIQRLIGRCLRGALWPERIGERTITIDCDVIQADGGTRTASVTGGFVALALAMNKLFKSGKITKPPFKNMLAAISVGLVDGKFLSDLNYVEDSSADVDMNLAADDRDNIVEVQATAEGKSYNQYQLNELTKLALKNVKTLINYQLAVLLEAGVNMDELIENPENVN